MKYMLLIHDDEKAWGKLSEPERQKIYGEYGQFGQQIRSAGQYLAGAQLQPTSAETREQLGGYYLVDARNLDEAIDIAARIPSARMGTIEVRPVVEMGAQATAATA